MRNLLVGVSVLLFLASSPVAYAASALETAKTDVNNAIGLAGPRYFREFHGSAWSHGGSTTRLL